MADGSIKFDTKLDSSGLKRDLPKLKSDVEKITNNIGEGFSKTGAKMTRYITKPALVAGAAVAGIAMKKGWDRLTAIDDAKAKLEALGHSAKTVEGIMDSALESVKGTSFGLGEAANTAASAVASGIKPGEELTRYLKLVSDAAAVAGTDMDEMGAVFNKVAANGKLSAEELNMLTDRGIPALSLLAKASGKTVEQIREDMRAGKISTEDFLNAIEEGMGGAAKIMGSKSLTAALSNIGASLSRIGANFLDAGGKGGGAFSQLKPLLADLADWLEKIEEKSVKWGETFGEVFRKITQGFIAMPNGIKAALAGILIGTGPMLKFVGAVLKASSSMATFKATAQGMSVARGILTGEISATNAVLGKFGGLCSAGASKAGNLAKMVGGKMAGAYGTATARLAALGTTQSTVNTLYGTSNRHLYGQKSGLKAAAGGVMAYTKRLVVNVAAHVASTASTVANTVANSAFGRAVGTVFGAVGRATMGILRFAAAHKVAMLASLGIIGAIVGIGLYMSKTGTSAEELAEKITTFADNAAASITAFAEAFPAMVEGFTDAIVGAIPQLTQSLVDIVSSIAESFPAIATAIVGALPMLIKAIVEGLVAAIPLIAEAGLQLFMGLVDSAKEIIDPLVAAIPEIISALVDAIIILVPAIIEAGITLLLALVEAIPLIIPPLVEALPQIIDAVVDALITLTPVLIAAAIQLFMAIVKAIPKIVKALIKALPQIASAIAKGLQKAKQAAAKKMAEMVREVWNKIKEIVKKFGFSGLVSKVTGVFNKVKNAITRPIDKAKELVNKAIKKIKSFFPLRIGKIFSGLKLPKISVSTKKGLLGIPVPKFSVNWNAKGAIFDKPTVLQGVGEAGAELVMPLGKFWVKMDKLAATIFDGMALIAESIERKMPVMQPAFAVPQGGVSPYAAQNMAAERRIEAERATKISEGLMTSGESAGDAIYALTDAMSRVKVTNILNCDGKTIATVTAPFMAPEIARINARETRKRGRR